jgi:hypothetical protein
VLELYAGMNARVDEICDSYTESQRKLIASFLRRVADAGEQSTEELSKD